MKKNFHVGLSDYPWMCKGDNYGIHSHEQREVINFKKRD